jgi:hypothetical protein
MGRRLNRRRLARAAWVQATTAGERLRGGRDERALLCCGRARPRASLKKGSGIRVGLARSLAGRRHVVLLEFYRDGRLIREYEGINGSK